LVVLGISDSHNSSACLYENGQIVVAINEERLRRVKNWAGFPEKAVEECLCIRGIDLGDVDRFALAGLGGGLATHNRDEIIAMYRNGAARSAQYWRNRLTETLVNALYRHPLKTWYQATQIGKRRDRERRHRRAAQILKLGVPEKKVVFVGHHRAHACSAYFGWGKFNEDILVLTNDGSGDRICATVNIGRNGKLECLAEIRDAESIGFIYSMATCLLGMVPLEHEYKLMGLAPYGNPLVAERIFKKLMLCFQYNAPDGMTWRRANGCPETYRSYQHLRNLFELERFDNICAGLQRFIEEFLSGWVRNCIRATGIRKVALAGGVFMNVKLNKAIMELPEVDDLFVFPSCGDETNSMGAAYHAFAENRSHCEMKPLANFYTGRQYDDGQIEQAIREYSFSRPTTVTQIEEIEYKVAELLAAGEIVARFSGREEFGARALGNRSVLADPSRPEVVKIINDAIKSRDFWMPFAPTVLDRRADDYMRNPKRIAAPYMILAMDAAGTIADFASAAHPYDHTIRPQILYRQWNPDYYALLEAFEQKTGRGILLNTSFNLHGAPIVSTPSDALQVFDVSGLKYLAIGNFLLRKEG
jgi:carbamoyltransferase